MKKLTYFLALLCAPMLLLGQSKPETPHWMIPQSEILSDNIQPIGRTLDNKIAYVNTEAGEILFSDVRSGTTADTMDIDPKYFFSHSQHLELVQKYNQMTRDEIEWLYFHLPNKLSKKSEK